MIKIFVIFQQQNVNLCKERKHQLFNLLRTHRKKQYEHYLLPNWFFMEFFILYQVFQVRSIYQVQRQVNIFNKFEHMNREDSKHQLLTKLRNFRQQDQGDVNARDSTTPGAHHYDNYYEYCLSLIGFAVGFGSFWRFPYLVYKNGGGAFLIPYFIAMFTVGIPLLYLETATGQMHQRSVPNIFARINKGYKMIGATFLFVCYHLAGYYNIILAYSYRFIFSVFSNPLPFAEESPSQNVYFAQNVLNKSGSINQFEAINPALFFFYVLSLFVCYMVIKNGVKTSGKIIMVTALLPYVFFTILLLRGFFLSGAGTGLKYLLLPDFTKLFALEIWIDAIVQVFYQMTVACSGIINLSSMKPKKQSFMLGVYLIPVSLVVCGMLCALNIFMYLGHFCQQYNLDINNLTLLGPELSFNIFPKALAILPWPNLWALCFFIAMVFLGIDSQFGYLESLFCYLKDQAQNHKDSRDGKISVFGYLIPEQKLKVYLIGSIIIFAPMLTSHAGIYYLGFFDSFVATIPLSLGAVIQYYFFVMYVPFDELQKQTQKYTGEKAPKWIQNLLKGKVVIAILLGNFGLAMVNQFFYFFKYTFGFYVFGWFITAYPYIIAYFYMRRNKQEKSRLTFDEMKAKRSSEF